MFFRNSNLFLFFFFSILMNVHVKGQDVQFSQFYAAQTYLNPGFAGAAHAPRAILQQRLQWPSLGAKYTTSLLSFDAFSHKYRSGFGVYCLYDYLGRNNFTSSEVQFQYSYELPITKKLTVRPGLQLGAVNRYMNYANLTFPQQFNDFGQQVFTNPYANIFGKTRKLYADIGAGAVFYTDNAWLSISANHINQPNQSVIGEVAHLPMKMTFAGGYKIHLKEKPQMAYLRTDDEEFSITPVINYKFQGKSDQVDAGVYVIYNQLITGMWYRGIPFKKYNSSLPNNEAMVFILGWRYGNFSVSYSYDYIISRLRSANPAGAHEINITYIHHHRKQHKPRKRLPCPTFYKHRL